MKIQVNVEESKIMQGLDLGVFFLVPTWQPMEKMSITISVPSTIIQSESIKAHHLCLPDLLSILDGSNLQVGGIGWHLEESLETFLLRHATTFEVVFTRTSVDVPSGDVCRTVPGDVCLSILDLYSLSATAQNPALKTYHEVGVPIRGSSVPLILVKSIAEYSSRLTERCFPSQISIRSVLA